MEASDRFRCDSALDWRRIVASRHCPLVPVHRFVLTCLSYYGNRYGENIFPSQATIAKRAGTCRKTVVEATEKAYQSGFIDRWQVGTGQGYKHYEYVLTLTSDLATEATINPDFWVDITGRRRKRHTRT